MPTKTRTRPTAYAQARYLPLSKPRRPWTRRGRRELVELRIGQRAAVLLAELGMMLFRTRALGCAITLEEVDALALGAIC